MAFYTAIGVYQKGFASSIARANNLKEKESILKRVLDRLRSRQNHQSQLLKLVAQL